MDHQEFENALDLGTWLGRKQAFGLISGKCSAAEARCLQTLRDEKRYLALGMNWDEFCREKIGVSRQTVERVIHNYEEFGPKYFELAAVLRLPAEQYRQIAPAVTDRGVVCGGETIEISAENSSRLAQAIDTLRGVSAAPAGGRPPRSSSPLARALHRARASFHEGVECYFRALQACDDPSSRNSVRREIESTRDLLTRTLDA